MWQTPSVPSWGGKINSKGRGGKELGTWCDGQRKRTGKQRWGRARQNTQGLKNAAWEDAEMICKFQSNSPASAG